MRQFAWVVISILFSATPADAQSLTPVGVWIDQSKRTEVEITPCGDQLCGNIVWFKWPNDDDGLPLVDLRNTEPRLRTRPLLGLSILYGLHRTGARTWGEGEIYDPENGKNYEVRMTLQNDNTLRVRSYELFPLFGETHIWTRIR